jgi:hypothetical protein
LRWGSILVMACSLLRIKTAFIPTASAPSTHISRCREAGCRIWLARGSGLVADAILAELPIIPAGSGHQMPIADNNYFGREFEAGLADDGNDLLRPARKGEAPRPGARFFKPLRQIVESVNQTLKGQLNLERHGGRTPAGVCAPASPNASSR